MLEPIEDQYLRVGYIARSHGTDGKVLIVSEVNVPHLFEEIDLAHIQNARGDLIPARIESARVQQKNNRLSFFVKFEHVSDRNQAEKLKGFPVFVSREKTAPLFEQQGEPDYTTFTIVDRENEIEGYISEVIDNPAHPLLQVITENREKFLVPFVDEYIVRINEDEKVIQCRNLNQLAEL